MKITIVAGARPNFMKIAPIIRAINIAREAGKDINYRLVYTGSKEDTSIDDSLFTDLNISAPDAFLNVVESSFAKLSAGIIVAFDKELQNNPSQLVLVVDDLTPTMSATIVAKKRGLKVAHLVAGTRSFDINMPKEMNRVITDNLSDYLFTAGSDANRNLTQTGTANAKMFYVGNILIDSIRHNRNRFKQPVWFSVLGLQEKQFILLTINKRSLIDKKENFKQLILSIIQNNRGLPILAPVRPYVEQAIKDLDIDISSIHFLPSQSYLNFGYLEDKAKLIITDSGNIAEEATFLGVPCITLSDYAEHPETCKLGTNLLVGEDSEQLVCALNRFHSGEWREGTHPERWDGKTAERIIQILTDEIR